MAEPDSTIVPPPELPEQPPPSFLDRVISPIGVAVIILLIALLSVGAYLLARKSLPSPSRYVNTTSQEARAPALTPTPSSSPAPTPTPIQLRPDNGLKGTYAVSQAKHDGPTISQVVFDPLDVQKGQKLTIDIKVTNTAPVQKITGVLETDNGKQEAVFTKTSGTDLSGMWQATLTLEDSVLYTYILRVTATAANGTGTVATAPRSR